MSLHDVWREHLRLGLLRCLANAPATSANDSILTDVIRKVGISASRDQVKTELQWLEEAGLIRLETIDTLLVAALTQRGEDVAGGRAKVPGVKKPSAG